MTDTAEPVPQPTEAQPEPTEKPSATAGEADAIQRVHEDIVKAQAHLTKVGKSVPNLVKHINEVLYPLLARTNGLTADLRDAIREELDSVGGIDVDDEYINDENITFLRGYIDEVIFPFVLKYSAAAKQQADTGNKELHEELSALYQGGAAVKKILGSIISEDEEDIDAQS